MYYECPILNYQINSLVVNIHGGYGDKVLFFLNLLALEIKLIIFCEHFSISEKSD